MNTNAKKSGVWHRTTIESSRATYTTISCAGQKRTFDQVQGKTVPKAVSEDITNSLDFRQPLLREAHYPPLRAGAVVDIAPKLSSEYSQRKALALTPGPTSNPLLDLSHPEYGLSEELVRNFSTLGIRSIYPWQSECLLRSGAFKGERNLVYTAPTGGGKSLVADILMLKRVIEDPEKKAMLVLPYVALVQEKLRWLRKVVEGVPKKASAIPQRPSKLRNRGDEEHVRVSGK
jgi:ATP-dependent helicase YprA (DUF1998 family)